MRNDLYDLCANSSVQYVKTNGEARSNFFVTEVRKKM